MSTGEGAVTDVFCQSSEAMSHRYKISCKSSAHSLKYFSPTQNEELTKKLARHSAAKAVKFETSIRIV